MWNLRIKINYYSQIIVCTLNSTKKFIIKFIYKNPNQKDIPPKSYPILVDNPVPCYQTTPSLIVKTKISLHQIMCGEAERSPSELLNPSDITVSSTSRGPTLYPGITFFHDITSLLKRPLKQLELGILRDSRRALAGWSRPREDSRHDWFEGPASAKKEREREKKEKRIRGKT